MKVMCIDDSMPPFKRHFLLKFGETYDATGEHDNRDGLKCYIIPSLPNSTTDNGDYNGMPLYKKSRFIPLPDIDETELVKQREKELINH